MRRGRKRIEGPVLAAAVGVDSAVAASAIAKAVAAAVAGTRDNGASLAGKRRGFEPAG
jgi:hypothetical protein